MRFSQPQPHDRDGHSVVVRANGQIEAELSSAEQKPSSELLGSSEPQLIYRGELYRKTGDPMASRKTRRRELEPGPGTQTTAATETTGT
jgi:hypothetical protein